MRIEYTGRNIDMTPAMQSHVEEKLNHAARSLGDVIDAHVILAVEKYRHIAEIVMRRRKGTLTGQAATRDMYQSIQKAIDRIEKQVRRKKEKVLTGRRRGSAVKAEVVQAEAATIAVPAVPRSRRTERRARAERAPLVVEETIDRVKPIAVEEALLLLEEALRPFVIFRNSASGRVGIVYRRGDGNYGLIEPKS